MSRILRLIGSMGCVAMVLASGVAPRAATNTARADDCLAQPDSSAPEGSHWYFHIDRATQRKCWYLRSADQQAQQPAANTRSPVTSTIPIPLEKPAAATSEAGPITPIPVEKPKTAASRGRPTTPIPLEKPASASAGAPMPVTTSTPEPPPPHIKMLTVISNGATDTLVQQDAEQRKNTTATTAGPAPQQSPSQTSDRATEPAHAAIIWPDPSKSLPTTPEATTPDHVETPTAARTEAPTESNQQPTSGAESADPAVVTAQANAATDKPAAANAFVLPEPVEMSLVAALGLVVAGFLFRIALKIASARRGRIIIDRRASHWLDDPNEHELRDEQQYAEPVHQREELIDEFIARSESNWMDDRNEYELRDGEQRSELVHERAKLVDELQSSLVTIASDDTPRRLFRNDDELQETLQRTDRDPMVADEIRKREDTLEQLKRDLDRLLRSPKVA
jgi:hypothetical protein